VHLVGFMIRIYHDERSPERQIHNLVSGQESPVPLPKFQLAPVLKNMYVSFFLLCLLPAQSKCRALFIILNL